MAATAETRKPLRCIVKLGGAAVTFKNEIETVNRDVLAIVCSQLSQAMIREHFPTDAKVLDMDWSRRSGDSDMAYVINDIDDRKLLDLYNFIVVHGAGSFGHFQASSSGVHMGGLDRPIVKAGLVATRISVTSFNQEVVRALAREGIPSIGISPFCCGWSTDGGRIESLDTSVIDRTISNGFVPVIHGDAVMDESQGCSILSGDVIIHKIAEEMMPDYVVFLTDVLGVFDRPPEKEEAVLLKEIAVNEDGSWYVVNNSSKDDMSVGVYTSVAAHDTTGGMATKIAEAAMIAKHGIDVYIVKAGTDDALRAIRGELRGRRIADDWLGTLITSAKTLYR